MHVLNMYIIIIIKLFGVLVSGLRFYLDYLKSSKLPVLSSYNLCPVSLWTAEKEICC